MQRQILRGLAYAAVAGLLYGATTVGARWAQAHPLAKASVVWVAAAIVLAPALRTLRPGADGGRIVAVGLLGGVAAPALLLFGLERATATDAGLLLTLQVVATAALAFAFLRERLSSRAATGLACLVAAAVAVALASGTAAGRSSPWGLLLIGLAAASWGVDNVLSTSLLERHRPYGLVAAKAAMGAVALSLGWAVVQGRGPAGIGHWTALGAIGVGIAAASLLYYRALGLAGAARSSALMVPASAFAAAAGGAALLLEPLAWPHGVALALILAGMGLLWKDGGTKSS